jgi:hypothetical protein
MPEYMFPEPGAELAGTAIQLTAFGRFPKAVSAGPSVSSGRLAGRRPWP